MRRSSDPSWYPIVISRVWDPDNPDWVSDFKQWLSWVKVSWVPTLSHQGSYRSFPGTLDLEIPDCTCLWNSSKARMSATLELQSLVHPYQPEQAQDLRNFGIWTTLEPDILNTSVLTWSRTQDFNTFDLAEADVGVLDDCLPDIPDESSWLSQASANILFFWTVSEDWSWKSFH